MPRDEANEEVKLKAIAALGSWLLCLEEWCPSALERIATGLKEKDTLRRAYLRVLNQVKHFDAESGLKNVANMGH